MKPNIIVDYSTLDQGKRLIRLSLVDSARGLPIGNISITLKNPYHQLEEKIINAIKLIGS